MNNEIELIPISQIRILNPRSRDRKKFALIVESIKNLGLKKPIQVSRRSAGEDSEPGYDLVCGQGRLEAFVALEHHSIPAIVVSVSKENRLLRSLIENMARRYPSPWDLILEVERLKKRGYSNASVGRKLDISDVMVAGLMALRQAGEERLLDATLSGKIPLTVAMEIAKTKDVEAQRVLLKAFEEKKLNGASIRTVKRLLDQRHYLGKGQTSTPRPKTTTDALVKVYRTETDRQKKLVRKAQHCDRLLTFFFAAFKKLFSDENFVTLLRAEDLKTVPQTLSDRVDINL